MVQTCKRHKNHNDASKKPSYVAATTSNPGSTRCWAKLLASILRQALQPTTQFVKSSFLIFGFACSKTRESRESMVLSMVIFPLKHAKTTPPMHEGPGSPLGAGGSLISVSKLNSTVLVVPVSSHV